MKNKKLLDATALAKLVAGNKPPETTATDTTATPDANTPDLTAETGDTVDTTELDAKITELIGEVETLTNAAAGFDTLLAAKETALTDLSASIEPLKAIVISQITTMRVGLSLAAVDMGAWDLDAIVAEYASTSKDFLKSMPAGEVVPNATGEEVVQKSVARIDYESFSL